MHVPGKSATIAIVDIVRYSDLSGQDQVTAIERLTTAVRTAETVQTAAEDVFFLPTGDGMVAGFFRVPERALTFARDLHLTYGSERFTLKIGIHFGLVFPYSDINGTPNFAGSSINMAQRVESCCDDGHILVAELPQVILQDLDVLRPYLHGPLKFRAKRIPQLRVFNFFDDAGTFGNSSEPSGPARIFETVDVSLAAALNRLGVGPDESLRYKEMTSALQNRLVVDDAILQIPFRGFAGVPTSDVRIESTEAPPEFPLAVLNAKKTIQRPEFNRKKCYLAALVEPVSDPGDILTLTVGPTEFWNALAIEQALPAIHQSIANHQLTFESFPRQLNMHLLVITSDSKVLLGRRAAWLRYRPNQWGASIGESIDTNRDRDAQGISLSVGVAKTLGETEELGLPVEDIAAASSKVIALLTESNLMVASLLIMTRLMRTSAARAHEYCTMVAHDRGEISLLDFIDFTIDAALPIAIRGRYDPPTAPAASDVVYGTSRLAIIAALCSEYGYGAVSRAVQTFK